MIITSIFISNVLSIFKCEIRLRTVCVYGVFRFRFVAVDNKQTLSLHTQALISKVPFCHTISITDLVPNGSDGSARYTYGAQPEICKWNLFKLAEALDPLLPLSKSQEIIELVYQSSYFSEYMDLMRKRLGLLSEQSGKNMYIFFEEQRPLISYLI